jgi:hypothetical protein
MVVAGVAAWSVRRAAFLLFILAVLGGGAAIQFHPRHFFYLEFMSWWAVGAALDWLAVAVFVILRVLRSPGWRTPARVKCLAAGVARSSAVVVVSVLAVTGGLSAARRYQQHEVTQMFDRALAAAGQPLTVATVPSANGRVRMIVDLPELALDPASIAWRSIATAYLVIDVNPQRCDSGLFSAIFRYETTNATSDNTAAVSVPLVDPQIGSSVKILVPVYGELYGTGATVLHSRFTAMDLSQRNARCVAAVAKVSDVGAFPVLLTAVLSADWRQATHYQTLTGIESRDDGAPWHERVYPALETMEISRSVVSQPVTDFWRDALVSSRAVTRVRPYGLAVSGRPASPYEYLVQSPERAIQRGTCAIARGTLTAGGMTFGLLRNGRWDQKVNILERGRFIATGCAQEDGDYVMVLANNNAGGAVTSARLTTIGWVGAGQRRE